MAGPVSVYACVSGGAGKLSVAVCALTLVFVKDYLADTDVVGSDLHIFILLDVFEGLFEGEYHRGTILALSSAPDARILVSFLLLVTFTTISLSLAFSPTT